MKDIAQSSGELLKGTTIRDVYDKVKIVLREDAQAQHGREGGESSKRHGGSGNRIPDVGPCNRGVGRVRPGLVLDDDEAEADVQVSPLRQGVFCLGFWGWCPFGV